MSNKREIKVLVVSLLFCVGLLGSLGYFFFGPSNIPEIFSPFQEATTGRISKGEKVLIESNNTQYKEAGVKAFEQGDYALAKRKFKASLQINPNDPEALIYLNNAEIGQKEALKIAVTIPITSNANVAQEILRGVAQAQEEVNNKGGIKGIPLQVEIADDRNEPKIAQELANIFVQDPEVMAVVGHNASNTSVAAAPIYEQGKLVMISPTSSSQKLSSMGKYIFRTAFDIRLMSELLADYVVKKAMKKSVTVCLDSQSVDNQPFSEEFNKKLYRNGAKIVDIDCDLADSNLNADKADQIVSNAIANGSDSILLSPHIDKINQAIAIIKANKQRLTLFSSPTLYTWQTLEEGQANVNGLVLAVPWHPEQHSNHPFLKEAFFLWKAPVNWRSATSYDATWTIINGLQQSPSRQTLSQVLHNNNFSFKGATGLVQFLPSGDRLKGKGVLVQVQPSTKSPTGYDFVPLK